MKKVLRQIRFWIYRKLNDGMPSREEARRARWNASTYRFAFVLDRYSDGRTLEEIAKELEVTRERIRQMVMKGCRQNREKDK